jgi:hypothetical protein
MRNILRLTLAASAIALAAPWSPATAAPGPAAPAQVQPRADGRILIRGFQTKTGVRLTLALDRAAAPEIHSTAGGIEIKAPDHASLVNAGLPKIREIASVDFQPQVKPNTAVIHLACDCEIRISDSGHLITVDLIVPPKTQAAVRPPNRPAPRSEMDELRDSLTQKLATLNAVQPVTAPPAMNPAAAVVMQQVAPAPVVRPACPPAFSMEEWRGNGPFNQRLHTLREQAATSGESAAAMAALAEFYIGNGLGGEATAAAQAARTDDLTDAERQRLARDADLGRLLMGRGIRPTSVLLTNPADCDRTDIPLWRALSASATEDRQVLAQTAEDAAKALQFVPEPLSQIFAFQIAAAAAPDDLKTLRAMASAVRNTDMGGPQEAAERFMLQARIAHARQDSIEEASFLERAIAAPGIPGLTARLRLARLKLAQNDAEGQKAELLLADAARVYRDSRLGQNAAASLGERRLGRDDYVGALQVVDDLAGGRSVQRPDSRAATVAARVLRRLFATKDVTNLPSPEERLMLYWHYAGYATPGAKGDDIRLGAARLMLSQGMPDAALDVARQFADATTASADGALIRASAEARAGDPNEALRMLTHVAPGPDAQRIAADALVRLGRVVEAAHQLEDSNDVADQIRRASMFFEARMWPEAAEAYADVLHNSSLPSTNRAETTDRYALALALSGKAPVGDLGTMGGLAKQVIGALPQGRNDDRATAVSALRNSLQRAGQIETMVSDPVKAPATRAQPKSGG